jgi:hypothetical protein
MQAALNSGRQTDVQKDICADLQIYIQIYRNKDVPTYTEKQTDRQCRSAGRQSDKQTDVQKKECTNILYVPTVHIKTDRQTEQTRKERQTDRLGLGIFVPKKFRGIDSE